MLFQFSLPWHESLDYAIHCKELLSSCLTILLLVQMLGLHSVKLYVHNDNVATVVTLNNASPADPVLNSIIRAFHLFIEPLNIQVEAFWVASEKNSHSFIAIK